MGCSEGPGWKQSLEESSVHFFVEESRKRTGTAIRRVKIQDTSVCISSVQLDTSWIYTYPLPHERATKL